MAKFKHQFKVKKIKQDDNTILSWRHSECIYCGKLSGVTAWDLRKLSGFLAWCPYSDMKAKWYERILNIYNCLVIDHKDALNYEGENE